jgi:hypothetical protein
VPTVTPLLLAIVSRPQQGALIWRLLKHARKRGYLTRDEFDRMVGPELPPDYLEGIVSLTQR